MVFDPITGGVGDIFGGGDSSGGSDRQLKHERQRFWGNFDRLLYQIEHDPMAWRQRKNIENFMDSTPDLMGLARGGAQRAGDVQSTHLMNALSARGGGNLQAALTAGAQGRVGAELGGIQAGLGMQAQRSNLIGDLINQYLGGTIGTKAGMLGSAAGFGGQVIGGYSRLGAANVGADAQIMSSMFGAAAAGAGGG